MNGFSLLILLAATGQVAGEAQRDYGWQISNEDGKLEYIIQVSPKLLPYMTPGAQPAGVKVKEKMSAVPPEVAARLSRIVVSIGDDPIVSAPMDAVLRIPVVTQAVLATNIEADAGRGRLSYLETAPSGGMMNVAGSSTPPSLGTAAPPPSQSPPVRDGNSLDPSVDGALGRAGSSALESLSDDDALKRAADAMRIQENLLAQNTTNPLLADPRSLSAPSKFSSTGTQTSPPQLPAASLPAMPSPSLGGLNMSTVGQANAGQPGNGYQTNGNLTGSNSYPQSTAPGYGATPGYQAAPGNPATYPATPGYANTPGYSTAPNYQAAPDAGIGPLYAGSGPIYGGSNATGNFAGLPRGTAAPLPYNPNAPAGQYSGYTNPAFATDPLALPTARLADNRSTAIVPTTSGASSLNSPFGNGNSTNGTRGNNLGSSNLGNGTSSHEGLGQNGQGSTGYSSYDSARSGMDNVMPVMFVLSLVVNFYLGMLIRKLLTRYRSLLSSVRSQVT